MLTPTEGAPSTLSDLKTLLEHDNKVKVAGEYCISSHRTGVPEHPSQVSMVSHEVESDLRMILG